MPPTPDPPLFATAVASARRFCLDLAPPDGVGLAVVCGGYEESGADYAIRRESFPYYSIEFVARGQGRLALGGRDYELSTGIAFAYGPDIPHEIVTNPASPLGKYFVDFVGTEASRLFDDACLQAGDISRVDAAFEISLLFNELVRDGLRGDSNAPALCAALLRCVALRLGANRIDPASAAVGSNDTYRRCVEHIDANAARLLSQQQVAAECGVSSAHLSRLFKAHGRQSAHQYLTRVRMNLAAERLLESDDLVQTIAAELGFSDPFHFSRTFKATLGVSPRAFRGLR